MDPATTEAAATAAGAFHSTFDAATILNLLWVGRLTVIPLGICSVIAVAVLIQQLMRYQGVIKRSRELTSRVVDALVKHDLSTARSLCEKEKSPLGAIFLEGLRWRNIALEDLNEVAS